MHDQQDAFSEDSIRGPFESYKAEGDILFLKAKYEKAIEAYSTALDIRPEDKSCLIGRSRCNLYLGNTDNALQDAESSLQGDPQYYKGLYQKAEALYCKGEFEQALMFYHRGHRLKSESYEFQLGINKAREAIQNSVGTPDCVKLTKEGDLSFFEKQDQRKNRAPRFSSFQHKEKAVKNIYQNTRPEENEKVVQKLLGNLYGDKVYLENLLKETDTSRPSGRGLYEIVWNGLDYLDSRAEFWRQQKPLYARKTVRVMFPNKYEKECNSITDYFTKELEKIYEEQSNGNFNESIKQVKHCLKLVGRQTTSTLRNKSEILSNLHSYLGNAYLETGQYEMALEEHQRDLRMSKTNSDIEAKCRSLDNLGRVYVRMGKFEEALDMWTEMLPLCHKSIERSCLHHEIGRCHFELGHFQEASRFGENTISEATKAKDKAWILNGTVLIAQAKGRLGEYKHALTNFKSAQKLAQDLEDHPAADAISKAITDMMFKRQAILKA